MSPGYPRLVIAGTSGDSGKTLVALGLLACFRQRGLEPAPFKKGPDYIDAAWLSWAAGLPCRNLDTFLQAPEAILRSFASFASRGVSVVEGNRGLHDGMDVHGTHSTAAMARLLDAPVVLVVNTTKVTRTTAAVVLGCKALDPKVRLVGVILNRVAGTRHERVVRDSVEQLAGVEVVGALPRLSKNPLPDRHLGLVTPAEHPETAEAREAVASLVKENVDLDRLLELAGASPELPLPKRDGKRGQLEAAAVGSVVYSLEPEPESESEAVSHSPLAMRSGSGHDQRVSDPDTELSVPRSAFRPLRSGCKIGYFKDSAFTFYYPENLEALQAAGAELVPVSGLEDRQLPPVSGLYLGGGFPETHAAKLADNTPLMEQVRARADEGMPIYAECGGMIYLARSLTCHGQTYPMAGVLAVDLELFARPQGHGYVEVMVDRTTPFFPEGTSLRGHEFHYTKVVEADRGVETAFEVVRGKGCFLGRDGIIYKNVLAGYAHLHALGVPRWAPAFVNCALGNRQKQER